MEYEISRAPGMKGKSEAVLVEHLNEWADRGWRFVEFIEFEGHRLCLWERIKVHV